MDRKAHLISRQAEIDIFEIAASRQPFDKKSCTDFIHGIPRMVEELCIFPAGCRVVGQRGPYTYRRKVYSSCNVIYHLEDNLIVIDRVFGPGRDWESDLNR